MKKLLILVFSLSVFLLCSRETSVIGPSTIPELSGYSKYSNEYIFKNDSVIGLLYKTCDCHLDSSAAVYETSKDITFNILNDTLTLEILKEEFETDESTKSFSVYSKYIRFSGEGLKGYWQIDTHYVSYSTILTEPDSEYISYMLFKAQDKVYDYIQITDRNFTFFSKTLSVIPSFSENFLRDWNIDFESKYDISVTIINDTSVLLSGALSADSVFINRLAKRDIAYSSPNPLFRSDTFWLSKPACPNPLYPSWLINKFLPLNLKRKL